MVNDKETVELWEKNILLEINTWVTETQDMDNENLLEGLLTKEEKQARAEMLEQCVSFMTRIFVALAESVPMEVEEV